MMRKKFIYTFCTVIIVACNAPEKDNAILQQPPFDVLTDSIKQFPATAKLYYRRGAMLYGSNQPALAEADITKAWTLDPTEEYALSLTTLLKKRNTDTAIVFIQSALKKLPNSIALQIGLARGYQQQNKTNEAVAVLDKILAKYPDQLDALTIKSELVKDTKTGESLSLMEKAYALVPSDPSLAYDLAYEYADRKNEKVLHLTDSLIKAKAPEIEKAFYTRGVYFANINNDGEALKNFNAAIRSNINFMDAYRDKGLMLFNEKKYDEAIKTYELALNVSPATAEFYYQLARVKEAMGNKTEAKLDYQRAYGLDKTMTEAKEAADKL